MSPNLAIKNPNETPLLWEFISLNFTKASHLSIQKSAPKSLINLII